MSAPDAIQIIAHPPERRRQRSGAPAQAGQCCCCCCCCLHTVGGLIGAAVAPAAGPVRRPIGPRSLEADDYDDEYWDPRRARPLPARDGISAVALYWLSVLGLCVIGTGIAAVIAAAGDGSAIVIWGFGLLLCFPAVQLVAAIPPAGYFLFARRADRSHEFGQLGRILFGLVVGTLTGIAAMALVVVVLRAL